MTEVWRSDLEVWLAPFLAALRHKTRIRVWTTLPAVMFPLLWLGIIMLVGRVSALHHNRLRLIPMAPLSLFYVLLAYTIWVVHGLKGLITGREPQRDKPTRYTHVVA